MLSMNISLFLLSTVHMCFQKQGERVISSSPISMISFKLLEDSRSQLGVCL